MSQFHPILQTIIYVLLAYVVLYLLFYFFGNIIAFPIPPSSYHDSPQIIKLTTTDGKKISAVYLPNEKAHFTILYSHGNAEDIGYTYAFLKTLQQKGFAVFAYDYHGYGTSEGKPNEQNTYLDIAAAYQYLHKQLRIPAKQIILYGASIGSGPSLELATREPVAGIVLQSPFTSGVRVLFHYAIFPHDVYQNIDKIANVHVPILIIHGKRDHVIRFWHGKALYHEANRPKYYYWVEKAGHNDLLFVAGEAYWQKLQKFVDTLK